MLRRGRGVLSEVLAIVALGVLAAIPGLAVAAVAKIFVDDVFIGGLESHAWPLVGVLLLLTVLQGAIQIFQQSVLVRLGSRLTVVESARFNPPRAAAARELLRRAFGSRPLAARATQP